ncbi:SIMPL domain-containing protein [Umezawaea endophytica]|uniref:SIMPL domain-containing protein n=1 Tax=Umezawaea endophytica TaxID=1654476 RepID=A0A9X2VSJ2_9PSEU|nr:SIMPL domain-containing protein [Umezawaea endophytica]MCS7480758.1 SIMPL domain-containing protein [Umezawaea endophytica]
MAEVLTKGTGTVERTADRAQVDVSFETSGGLRNEAVEALTSRVSTVEPLLNRPGIEVRSRQLSVHDNWDGNTKAGSRASQRYVLRVTDLAELDGLLAALVLAEPTWLNGPSWDLTDTKDAVFEAQQDAVADARLRAQGYAEALGRRLGPLVRLSDGDGGDQWQMDTAMSARSFAGYGGSPGTPVQVDQLGLEPQQITVTVRCSATWSLLD